MGVLWWNGAEEEASVLISLLAFSIVLSTASLSIGMLVSSLCRASASALGGAIFLWLALAFGADLSLIGASFAASIDIHTLFHLTLLNPLSVFRMATVLSIRSNLEILGPAGLYAVQTYGAALLPLFVGALAAWVVVPLVGAMQLFRWRDAT
jgi:Cu-processing system permease protein